MPSGKGRERTKSAKKISCDGPGMRLVLVLPIRRNSHEVASTSMRRFDRWGVQNTRGPQGGVTIQGMGPRMKASLVNRCDGGVGCYSSVDAVNKAADPSFVKRVASPIGLSDT